MSQASSVNRRWVLASYPVGEPRESDFTLESVDVPAPGKGQVLLRTLYLSLDPYMRGRMSTAQSYAAGLEVGQVIVGGTVSEVVESLDDHYPVGEVVEAYTGWQEYAVVDAKGLRKIDPAVAPISTAVGVLGMPGLTAYVGLRNIGQPKAGETVVVGAASGAVGSVVGQLAKLQGARVVGVAGGQAKCDYVVKELGFDACVDHRASDLRDRLMEACPSGVDVYFENVGGCTFEAVVPLLNPFARVPVCGLIAHYNATEAPPGPNMVPALMRRVLTHRLTLRGFIVFDYKDQWDDFIKEVGSLVHSGKLKYREDISQGLESAPRVFQRLFNGDNFGKLLVRVADPLQARL